MRRSADDAIADPQRLHDVEAQQGDMRRLEQVATSIEYDLGGLITFAFWSEACQEVGRQLQARQHAHTGGHTGETLKSGAPAIIRRFLARLSEPRHRQHEARIDAVLAGRNAMSAA